MKKRKEVKVNSKKQVKKIGGATLIATSGFLKSLEYDKRSN